MPTASRLELLFLHSSNIYKVNRSVCFSMKLLEWRREYDDSVGGIKTPGKGNCLFHMNQCPARLWNSGLVMQSLDSQMQHNHGEQTKATNGLSSSHDLYPVNIKPPIMIPFFRSHDIWVLALMGYGNRLHDCTEFSIFALLRKYNEMDFRELPRLITERIS